MTAAMVRVAVPDLDDTFLGLRVEVSTGDETHAGGVSDVHRCVAGGTGCPDAIYSPLLGQSRVLTAHTHLWVGGRRDVLLLDDDVVLAPAPPPEYSTTS